MVTIVLAKPQTDNRPLHKAEVRGGAVYGVPLPAAAQVLRERSHAGIAEARAAETPADRYVTAHLAALRAAAAILAVVGHSGQTRPRSVWELVQQARPELGQWCAFFTATAKRRSAVETGRGAAVSQREADDLIRDVESFMCAVEATLGVAVRYGMPQR